MKTIVYIRSTDIYYDSRATKEIAALMEAGYRVVVLGWDRAGGAMDKCRETFQKYGHAQFLFYDQPMPNGIGMKNIGKLMGWFRWVGRTLAALPQVDLIHACDLDGALGAKGFLAKHPARLVYDIYDYYVDTHANIPGVLRSMVEKLEIGIINRADLTIICTEERRAQITKAKPRKLIVLHNSPDLPALPDNAPCYDYVYCGNLAPERLTEEILKRYEANADLTFCFAGLGAFAQEAAQLSDTQQNFQFAGMLQYAQVLETESRAVCLSAIYDPSWKNHQLCAPNKFYEALALGKPIIVCKGTGIDEIVRANHLGAVIEYNADQFYQAVRYFKAHPAECADIKARARALYDQKYQWKVMRERLLDAYQAM